MAFSKDAILQTTLGHKRMIVYSCTADAATDAIATDLSSVDFAWYQAQSCTSTGSRNLVFDQGPASTAIAGTVGASGFVSGDVFTLFAVGR
jgi:hypothetical protein